MSTSETKIIQAFKRQLGINHYSQITASELMSQAKVSRSTFYRHFGAKLDVLLRLHELAFHGLLKELKQPQDWHAITPPESLVTLLKRFEGQRILHGSMTSQMGADGDLAHRRIQSSLEHVLQHRLEQCFEHHQWAVPLELLVHSIGGLYMTHLSLLRQKKPHQSAEHAAQIIHRHTRALVLDAALASK